MNKKNQTKKKGNSTFPLYFYNRITYVGAFVALIIFVIECFLFGMDFFADTPNVYLGIITYIVLPMFLIPGLLLIPLGAYLKYRRVSKGLAEIKPKPFHVDLSIASHRNATFVFLSGTTILIIMTGIGSYKGFHYTESNHFCGIVCHKVMKPEYTTYLNSPHARVKCVDCHIGSGADWYVRSKLSGTRQIFATIGNTYPHPIPTPIEDLRPAEETCEQCHWPEKFYPSFEVRHEYFPTEKGAPPKWILRMLVHEGKDGGGRKGLHAHITEYEDIFYVADEKRQKISWVKSIDKNGKERIYTTEDSEYRNSEPPPEKIRKMDCMDCHNRPSHQFKSPRELLNRAMEKRLVDSSLPNIKQKAMELMAAEYTSQEEGVEAIEQSLTQYYKENHADIYSSQRETIDETIKQITELYKNNFFPIMKARWDVYPENIGHMNSPGCFRCHDDEHTTKDGKTISKDCKICHTILEQGPPDKLEKSTDGLEFKHPVDIDEAWKEMNCYDCHDQ